MQNSVGQAWRFLFVAVAALGLWNRAEAASNAPACPTCLVGYPYASTNPLTSIIFNESEVLRAYNTNVVDLTDTIRLWYNDEHALTLGIRRVIIKTSTGSTTNDYPITALATNPSSAINPLVGSTNLSGDQAGTDLSSRPMFPALFITDTTQDSTSRAGDWQFGGQAYPPHAVFGSWKGAVRTVDYTKAQVQVTIQPDVDPAKNNWNLGGGDPAPAGLRNEGYGAEVRWNVADLKLLPGHSYRLYFMVHDGDQNQAGGDSGQGCVTICMPCLPLNVTALTNLSTCEGDSALFSTSVINGTGPYSYPYTFQWYRGTTPLAGETNGTLQLTNLVANDSGTYTVVVTGSCGTPVTNSATLTVSRFPTIATPPANQISIVGSNATFSAGAPSAGLNYQWSFKDAVVGTNSVLTLNNLTTNQAGIYCLVVSSPCGTPLTNCATLTVNEPVHIITPPINHTNCPGDTLSFSVTATGTALTYQWLRDGNELVGQTNNILVLTDITPASAGNYCVIVDGAAGGPITNCAALVVNQNTIITTSPTNQIVCQNGTVTFDVGASGTALTYQWFLGGVPLSGQTASTLVLTNISLAAAGNYTVIVGGVCAPPVTNSASLIVNQNVSITTPPVSQIGFVGSNAAFTVTAMGTNLTYQWFFNGVLVGTSNTLSLSNLNTNQAGTYCVVVSGTCGGPVTNCTTLTIQNRAPTANNDAYTAIEDTALTIAAPGVLANDADPDGDTLRALVVSNPTHGTLTLNNSGAFTYTPSLNYTGADTFTYRASDGSLTSGVATVTITITPVNDAPVANNDAYTVTAGTTLNITAPGVLANDIDVDGDPLSAVLANNPMHGTLSLSANGSFIYIPATNFSGSDGFTYRAIDGRATSAVATVSITVVPVPIIIVTPPTDRTNCPGGTATFSVAVTGTAPTYQWHFGTNVLDGETNSTLVLTNITAASAGDYCVMVDGADGGPLVDCATLTVNQNIIVATPPANQTVCRNTTAQFNVGATGTGLTYQWYFGATPLVGQSASTLMLSNVALNAAGTYSVVVSGACGIPVTNSAILTVNQNVAVVTPPANQISLVGSNATFSVSAIGTSLTYQWIFNGTVVGTNSTLTLNNLATNQAGTYCVVVSGACGNPATNCTTLTLQNRAPVANNDAYTTPEDTTLTIDAPGVLANDSDPDGDTLTALIVSTPAHGLLQLNANGSFVYTPSLNYTGADTFTYRASDTRISSGTATVTITITPVNDAPVANGDSYTMTAGTTLNITAPGVLANDTDVDGDALSAVLASNPAHGTLALIASGSFTYTPETNFSGNDSFTYRAHDGRATSSVATVSITVVPVPIVIVTPPINRTNCPGEAATFSVSATGTALAYQWFFSTNALVGQTNSTLVLSNVSAANMGGYCVVVDGAAGGPITNCAALIVNQNVIVTTPPSNQAVCQNAPAQFTVGATGTALRYQWYFGTTLLANQTGNTLALLNAGLNAAGTYTVVVSGTCGAPVTNSATLTVNQNISIVTAPSSQTSFVGSNATFSVGAIGTGLTYQWFFNGEIVSTNSTLSLNNLTTNRAGTYCVVVSGACGSPATNCTTLTIQNRAPAANNDAYTVAEDNTLTISAPGVLSNDTDPDGDSLTAMVVSNPSHGTLMFNPNGSFTYTPSLNYTGVDTFIYRASDSRLFSEVAMVTLTITPLNDAPVANNDNYTIAEDNGLTITAPGVLANDTDVDGDSLRAFIATNPEHGTVTLNTNGAFVYTPSLNYTGSDTFTYRATDGALTSGVATVTISITPVNDAPVANDDNYSIAEDTALTIAAPGVLSNDIDVDGDPLLALIATNPAHGTITLNTNGAFVYTPSLNYTGSDTFTYRATDGALTSGVATVTITITAVNDAPVANNDSYTISEDNALTIAAPGVLANDIDVDGDTLQAFIATNPTHGTVTLNTNGAFVYTPSLNYTGSDTFTYRATDGALTSGVATVTISITPVNDAPVANADAYSISEDTALTIAAPGVLANDVDVDGDSLRAFIASNPAHGTVTLSTNGAFVYTPSLNYTGSDAFTYRATDGALTSAVATVTITITPVNDAPVANDDAYTIAEDTTLTISAPGVLSNDNDVDGDPLSAVLVSGPSHGTLNLSTNGAFTYVPSLNYTGSDTFTYRASDTKLQSGIATVTITITPVNDAPVAVNDDAYTVAEDTTLTVPPGGVLTNDIDVDGDTLFAVLVNTATNGTLTLSSNGGFVYRPNTNFNGVDHFTYRATDGALTSDVAVVTITVTPQNDAPIAIDDAYNTDEDASLTVTAPGVLANDFDIDGDTLSAVLVSTVAHGALSLNANGSFSYTPNSNFNGTDSFTYRASDGALSSGTATVTITIRPMNDRPSAVNDDGFQVLEDRTLVIAAPGVLANDTDIDGDALTALIASNPAHGTVTLNANGSFTYRPQTNYFGSDSFTYRASDGLTSSAPATVSIAVIPVNDPPTFTGNGDVRINQNAGAQSVAWAQNISPGPANESGQAVNFIVSNDNAALFTVQPGIAPNGTLTYTLAANAPGVATVHVIARDNGGTANGGVDTSGETIFRIIVNGPPTVEIVSPMNGLALISPATFSVIASANDTDGTVTNVAFLVNGVFRTNVSEAPFYFIMSNASPGGYQFRAIATDNGGLMATSAPVSIEVITNAVVAVGPIVLNRQNGLFEQFVTVSNRTTETWANGVRLLVKLPTVDTTNVVWKPTGTNQFGVPYLDKTNAVAPNGEIMFLVQYYVPNERTIPSPMLLAVPLPYTVPQVAPRITEVSPAAEGMVNVKFNSQKGRYYFVQSSDDLVHWKTEPASMAGTGDNINCLQPRSAAKRFYRVLMLP